MPLHFCRQTSQRTSPNARRGQSQVIDSVIAILGMYEHVV